MKEQLIKLYYKYRFYILPGFAAIFGLAIALIIIGPQFFSFLNNQQALKKSMDRLGTIKAKAMQLENLNEADLKKGADITLAVLPDEKDYSTILGLIQSDTAANGFTVLNFQIGSNFTNSTTGAQGFSVKLELAGPAANFKNLLDTLENSTPILRLSSIEVSNPRGASRLEVILSVDTYYSSLPKTIGAVDAPLPQLSSQDQQALVKYSKIASFVPVSTSSGTLSPRGKLNPFE